MLTRTQRVANVIQQGLCDVVRPSWLAAQACSPRALVPFAREDMWHATPATAAEPDRLADAHGDS